MSASNHSGPARHKRLVSFRTPKCRGCDVRDLARVCCANCALCIHSSMGCCCCHVAPWRTWGRSCDPCAQKFRNYVTDIISNGLLSMLRKMSHADETGTGGENPVYKDVIRYRRILRKTSVYSKRTRLCLHSEESSLEFRTRDLISTFNYIFIYSRYKFKRGPFERGSSIFLFCFGLCSCGFATQALSGVVFCLGHGYRL